VVQYLQALRIASAKKLLENTDIRTVQISQMVGFQSNSYFLMLFRKQVGLTPKQVRLQAKGAARTAEKTEK